MAKSDNRNNNHNVITLTYRTGAPGSNLGWG